MEKIAISVSEAAKLLGVSVPKAYEWARRPGFPAFQPDGPNSRIVVNAARLQEWMDKECEARGGIA